MADLDDALGCSKVDLFGGGLFWDLVERNSLSKAEVGVSKVQILLEQAQHLDPNILSIGTMEIANGHILSEVVFDNIITDMRMHERIKDTMQRLKIAATRLEREISNADTSLREVQVQSKQAALTLGSARSELQQVRQEAFERVSSGRMQAIDPPPYDYKDSKLQV